MKQQTLNQLRKKIDLIDKSIIKKLAARQKLAAKIGQLKAKTGKQIQDNKREKQLFRYYDALCMQHRLSTTFVKQVFKIIISNSRKSQSNVKI